MAAVLIVDDNPDLLDVLAEVLHTLGRLCVHKARSGLEALRLYASLDPALVILDEGLADMRGSELLRTLRLRHAQALCRGRRGSDRSTKARVRRPMSTGFSKCSWKPASSDRSRPLCPAAAVSAMAGTPA
jgi:CheY-like chemotaxis protein